MNGGLKRLPPRSCPKVTDEERRCLCARLWAVAGNSPLIRNSLRSAAFPSGEGYLQRDTHEQNITLIYGDCSSPEIVTQAVRVLDKIAARHGHTFTYTRAYMGGEAIDRFGDPLPASELEKCKSSDQRPAPV